LPCNVTALAWPRTNDDSSFKYVSYAYLYARIVLKKFSAFSAASCWMTHVSQKIGAHFLSACKNSCTKMTAFPNVSFKPWLIITRCDYS
jgi:hypothetical protein